MTEIETESTKLSVFFLYLYIRYRSRVPKIYIIGPHREIFNFYTEGRHPPSIFISQKLIYRLVPETEIFSEFGACVSHKSCDNQNTFECI